MGKWQWKSAAGRVLQRLHGLSAPQLGRERRVQLRGDVIHLRAAAVAIVDREEVPDLLSD